MTPKDRIKLYAQLAALGAVLVWAVLCFFVILSPKLSGLGLLTDQVNSAKQQLADMKREIEDVSIAGPPTVGASRFEKFGILGADEEQLFLSDLIDFCTETKNTLNLVRRADVARPAARTTQSQQGSASGGSAASSTDPDAPPQPTIEKVPHNVSYSGTFLSSFYLLRKLESYKRLLTVERMEVVADTQFGYPQVNGTITIDLYLVKNVPLPATGQQAAAAAQQAEAAGQQAEAASGEPRPSPQAEASREEPDNEA
jgi:hypothetical protein